VLNSLFRHLKDQVTVHTQRDAFTFRDWVLPSRMDSNFRLLWPFMIWNIYHCYLSLLLYSVKLYYWLFSTGFWQSVMGEHCFKGEKRSRIFVIEFLLISLFFDALGFELRVLHLKCRCSTTWATPLVLFGLFDLYLIGKKLGSFVLCKKITEL
jgi:hypothetical protein